MKLAAGIIVLACTASGCGSSAPPDAPSLSFAAASVVFPDTAIDRVAADGVKSIAVMTTIRPNS